MGCLSACNRMHSSPNEGVVTALAPPARWGLSRQSSPGYSRSGARLAALTLWNSLATHQR